MIRALALLAVAMLASACTQSIKEIGSTPKLSPVNESLLDPDIEPDVMTYKDPSPKMAFSTWNTQKGDLFTDKLAVRPGDILTVSIEINDRAKLSNQSDSKRSVGRGLNIDGSYSVGGIGNSGNGAADVNSTSDFSGTGGTTRSETIKLSVAAVVTRTLSNGNLVVRGSQEVRVNSELRVLTIAGIVRPHDIGANNTISYDRIAQARVSYGGRGHISQVQRPPYGQQVLNQLLPF